MRKPSINFAINVTKSEESGRVILHWETPDKVVGGNFDVTEIVLLAFQAERDCAEARHWTCNGCRVVHDAKDTTFCPICSSRAPESCQIASTRSAAHDDAALKNLLGKGI